MINPFERFISPQFEPAVMRFDIAKSNDIDIEKRIDEKVVLRIKTLVYVPVFSEGLKSMEADLYSLNDQHSQITAITGMLSFFNRSSVKKENDLFLFDSTFQFDSLEIPKTDTLFGINIFFNIVSMKDGELLHKHIFSTVIPIRYINQGK